MAVVILDLGPGLYKTSGGLRAMIPRFRKALNSKLVCFVNPRDFKNREWGVDEAEIITGLNIPVLRTLCIPGPFEHRRLQPLLDGVNFLSAHCFYRYHLLWAHKTGLPYWSVPHGVLDPFVLRRRSLAKKLFLKFGGLSFLKDAACTIFATETEKQKAESVFGDLRGEVVHWPVEQPGDIVDRETARQKLGIDEKARVLLYFGRVCGAKRALQTIEAAAAVKHEALHLVMMGPSEEISEDDCLTEARRHGLKNIHFLGPRYGQDKWNVMAACDAYISLSHKESFNLTAMECSAAGLPVIVSTGNNVGSLVTEVNSGWYLESDAPQKYSDAIRAFIDTPSEELIAMGERGHQLVAERFGWDTFQRKLRELAARHGK